MISLRGELELIDITIPRECIYKKFKGQPGPCPRCGGPLQSHAATYLVDTRRGKKIADSFMIDGDIGWFCARCPTVVINPEEVRKFLGPGLPGWNVGAELAVLGIVDLDAVPEDKHDVPLGEEDNPIPLVEFTTVSDETMPHRVLGPSKATVLRRGAPGQKEGKFEERYEDVLQNIEAGIMLVYRNHPKMTDWEVGAAVEALIRRYQAEAKGRRQATPPSLDSLAQEVYDSVEGMCEWRLWREMPFSYKEGEPMEFPVEPITLHELIACLKRVRKSINFWTREGGRQGYLTFVSQFIP